VTRADFVAAMASAVNGVGILTTDGPAGRFGITVSSVASVSADPPMILVCVNQRSPVHDAIRENGMFAVNLLAGSQRELADTFAGHPSAGEAFGFTGDAWPPGATGAPRLSDAVSAFDCVLEQSHAAGSHTVFIGRVVATTGNGGDPLLYTARSYGIPCRWKRTLKPAAPETPAAIR
jgi:flavin reductase (DIM6/NTAB) family NADH-FMN oxidoreductase RutF